MTIRHHQKKVLGKWEKCRNTELFDFGNSYFASPVYEEWPYILPKIFHVLSLRILLEQSVIEIRTDCLQLLWIIVDEHTLAYKREGIFGLLSYLIYSVIGICI